MGFVVCTSSAGPTVFCAHEHKTGVRLDFWQVLPVAVALVFIIEGALPFISPGRWRNMLAIAGQMDDRAIRNIGLGCMLIGVVLLYLVN